MSVYRKILQWLENELFEGNLTLGQNLPDDRRLATLIGASNSSTREGLKTLEVMGIVRLYEGKRKTIITRLEALPVASSGPAVRLQTAASKHPARDMVQAQVLIESWAVAHADPEHPAMAELSQIIDKMQADGVMPQDFHKLEVDFHIVLTKLAGNAMMTALMSAMRDSLYEFRLSLMGRVPLWSSLAVRVRAEHQAIFDAIRSSDTDLAQKLLLANIDGFCEDAGIDLDEASGVVNDIPGALPLTTIEPVEVDTEDSIPEQWTEAPAPQLLDALSNIQPVGSQSSPTSQASSEAGRMRPSAPHAEPAAPAQTAITQSTPSTAVQGEELVSESDPVEKQACPSESEPSLQEAVAGAAEASEQEEARSNPRAMAFDQTEQTLAAAAQQELPVSEETADTAKVLRAPARPNRRLRGTVSTPVHATVIKPIAPSSGRSNMISGQVPSLNTRPVDKVQAREKASNVLRAKPRQEPGKTLTGAKTPRSASRVEEVANQSDISKPAPAASVGNDRGADSPVNTQELEQVQSPEQASSFAASAPGLEEQKATKKTRGLIGRWFFGDEENSTLTSKDKDSQEVTAGKEHQGTEDSLVSAKAPDSVTDQSIESADSNVSDAENQEEVQELSETSQAWVEDQEGADGEHDSAREGTDDELPEGYVYHVEEESESTGTTHALNKTKKKRKKRN